MQGVCVQAEINSSFLISLPSLILFSVETIVGLLYHKTLRASQCGSVRGFLFMRYVSTYLHTSLCLITYILASVFNMYIPT